jgi:hypothetical protein
MKRKIISALLDFSASAWSWLGMGIAWVVLEPGSTRDFVGASIVALLILWGLTGPLRWGGEE